MDDKFITNLKGGNYNMDKNLVLDVHENPSKIQDWV